MPPTSPCGIPTTAVVFARFIVGEEDRGVKPFNVMLHDGHVMCRGISSKYVNEPPVYRIPLTAPPPEFSHLVVDLFRWITV